MNDGQGASGAYHLPMRSTRSELVQVPPAEPYCVLFAGQFILSLPNPDLSFPLEMLVEDRFGARRVLTVQAGHQVHATEASLFTCIVVPLGELIRVSLNAGLLKISLTSDGRTQYEGFLKAEQLDASKANDLPVAHTLQSLVKAGFLDARIGLIFDSSTSWIDHSGSSDFALEAAYQTPFGLLVDGWITNIGRRDLIVMSSDLVAMTPVEDFIIRARPDIRRRLMQDTFSRVSGQLHGFSASFPGCREGSRAIYLVERLPYGGQVIGPIPYQPITDRDEALRLACERLLAQPDADGEAAVAFLAPLVATPQLSVRAEVNEFGPEQGEPDLSIIVSVSGADVFLHSLILQQRRLKAQAEWIFCAEAGVMSQAALRVLSESQKQLRQRVLLVEADADASLCLLLNAGTRFARSKYLLFLDETSWINNPQALQRALKDLESGASEAVSLVSLLDDGALDHLGFAIRPDPHYRHLVTIEANGRGLPLPKAGRRSALSQPVEAVTAMGLMIGQETFEQVGGFDERISGAEIAGADLSVRLRQIGGRIALAVGDGLIRGYDGDHLGSEGDPFGNAHHLLDRLRLMASLKKVRPASPVLPSLTDERAP